MYTREWLRVRVNLLLLLLLPLNCCHKAASHTLHCTALYCTDCYVAPLYCLARQQYRSAPKIPHPNTPLRQLQDDFLGSGKKSANAERCIYGNIPTRSSLYGNISRTSSQRTTFVVLAAPPGFGRRVALKDIAGGVFAILGDTQRSISLLHRFVTVFDGLPYSYRTGCCLGVAMSCIAFTALRTLLHCIGLSYNQNC